MGDLSRYDAKVILSYIRFRMIPVKIPVSVWCSCNGVRNTPFKFYYFPRRNYVWT